MACYDKVDCDAPRDDAHVAAFNNFTRTTPFTNALQFFNFIQEKKRKLTSLKIQEFHKTEKIEEEEVQGWESRGDTPYSSEEEQENEEFFWNKKY